MLPSELLRTRINQGRITPIFCSTDSGSGTNYELAGRLVIFFADAQKEKQCKGDLLKKVAELESEYDYKLVRGFCALLERRSVFGRPDTTTSLSVVSPVLIRQRLFEESSRCGLALSEPQRQDIIKQVADEMHVSSDSVETIMWSDKDENLILTRFDHISTKDLILWYNLSLFQTLLFRCTRLEFYVKGGLHWKQVLRNVKRYGLMYNLEYHAAGDSNKEEDSIKCVLEGPLSLFRMTDRYGTSMAKLLPSIVGTPTWRISGSILKKTGDGQKIYSFELSDKNTREFLRLTIDSPYQNDDDYIYDSSAEAAFAKRFNQHFDQSDRYGWKISREPDPLVADGKAMIPDFLFERFGHKVYFEIVGFWTKEYLERKAAKLEVLFDSSDKDNKNVDLLVAVNSELSCSQIETISRDRIFTFKKNVSIKPVLEHLKKIDEEITEEKAGNTKIKLDENDLDLISVTRIAREHAIPEAAALKILMADYPGGYVRIGSYLISKEKTEVIGSLIEGVPKFVQACIVMASHGIPDSCHADLLSGLGYDVVWNDLDPDNATIIKKQS